MNATDLIKQLPLGSEIKIDQARRYKVGIPQRIGRRVFSHTNLAIALRMALDFAIEPAEKPTHKTRDPSPRAPLVTMKTF